MHCGKQVLNNLMPQDWNQKNQEAHMVVIENEDNLIVFSVSYIPYDIKDIK